MQGEIGAGSETFPHHSGPLCDSVYTTSFQCLHICHGKSKISDPYFINFANLDRRV